MTRARGLDLLRGLAVLAMILVHAGKAFLDDERHFGLGWWIYVPEPVIPATFLALSGYAVALANARGLLSWRTVGRRALELWAIAAALFLVGYGVRLPDLVTSPGILAMIGVSSLVALACLQTARPVGTLAVVLGLHLGLYTLLDRLGVHVLAYNWGNESLGQNLAYALVGAIVGQLHVRRATQPAWRPGDLVAFVPIACAMGYLVWSMPTSGPPAQTKNDPLTDTVWSSLFYGAPGRGWLVRKMQGRHLGHQIEQLLGHPVPTYVLRFWVSRPPLVAFLCGLVALTMGLRPLLDRLAEAAGRVLRPIEVLGRHALVAYAVHLVLIGPLMIVLGARRMAPPAMLGWFAAVAGAMIALAHGLEARKQHKARVVAASMSCPPATPRSRGRKKPRVQ